MITGTGIDIVELKRIEKILSRKQGFIDRVLGPKEMVLIQNKSSYRLVEIVAGRFAAKEAVAKALGVGIGATIGFHDIEILPDSKGKPTVHIRTGFHSEENTYIHLSISHSREYAIAQVIIEQV